LLYVERSTLQTLLRQRMLDVDTAQELAQVVDARLLAVQYRDTSSSAQAPPVGELAAVAATDPRDDSSEAAERHRSSPESGTLAR
jgi:hypothetical protein